MDDDEERIRQYMASSIYMDEYYNKKVEWENFPVLIKISILHEIIRKLKCISKRGEKMLT